MRPSGAPDIARSGAPRPLSQAGVTGTWHVARGPHFGFPPRRHRRVILGELHAQRGDTSPLFSTLCLNGPFSQAVSTLTLWFIRRPVHPGQEGCSPRGGPWPLLPPPAGAVTEGTADPPVICVPVDADCVARVSWAPPLSQAGPACVLQPGHSSCAIVTGDQCLQEGLAVAAAWRRWLRVGASANPRSRAFPPPVFLEPREERPREPAPPRLYRRTNSPHNTRPSNTDPETGPMPDSNSRPLGEE